MSGDFSFPVLGGAPNTQPSGRQAAAAPAPAPPAQTGGAPSNPFAFQQPASPTLPQQQQQQPQQLQQQPQQQQQQPAPEPLTARSTVVHASSRPPAQQQQHLNGGGGNNGMQPPAAPKPKPVPISQVKAEGRRNKVPLEKGFSQVSWMKLTKSGQDLTAGGHGRRRDITLEEVAQHRTADDAWMVLHGKVYNITPYLPYHPGGADVLMKAAGKDGTVLFNKYHPWVNAGALLEKCLIGHLHKPEGDAPSTLTSRLVKAAKAAFTP